MLYTHHFGSGGNAKHAFRVAGGCTGWVGVYNYDVLTPQGMANNLFRAGGSTRNGLQTGKRALLSVDCGFLALGCHHFA